MNEKGIMNVDQISYRYGQHLVLQDISWNIKQGENWGIIGPNGSGKSTLLRLLSGVDEPYKGKVSLYGRPINSFTRKQLARHISVLQQSGLPKLEYSVKQIVEMGRMPYENNWGIERSTRPRDTTSENGWGYSGNEIIDEVLKKFDLYHLANRKLCSLSGGQRQRVGLAKALVQQPTILLLDEPTTSLDIHYQMEFMELLSEWKLRFKFTVVTVVHDLNVAAQYCDQLMMLNKGEIVASGTPQHIITKENVQRIFQVCPHIIAHPDTHVPQLLFRRRNDNSR